MTDEPPEEDPFADLEGPDRGDPLEDLEPGPDPREEDEGVDPGEPAREAGAPGDEDDPFSGLGGRSGDPFSEDETFEQEEVDPIAEEQVWDQLTGAAERPGGRQYAEVDKHSYCEHCEYFSGPPAVECGHERTEIVEFVDMETVRVVDCPVVAERRGLAETDDLE